MRDDRRRSNIGIIGGGGITTITIMGGIIGGTIGMIIMVVIGVVIGIITIIGGSSRPCIVVVVATAEMVASAAEFRQRI